MAKNKGIFDFQGSFGNVTVYRLKGVDHPIVRAKSGVSRARIMNDPAFKFTRQNNEEWKACVEATKNIVNAMYIIRDLADYNFWGPLTALCKSIQLTDKGNTKGKRSVLLSAAAFRIEGFSINKYQSFTKIVHSPFHFTVLRETGSATIQIPEIISGSNLFNPRELPLYRFILQLGAVPDTIYKKDQKTYSPAVVNNHFPVTHITTWNSSETGSAAESVRLQINGWENKPGMNLLLSAGIEFGMPALADKVNAIKYSGAAKILRLF